MLVEYKEFNIFRIWLSDKKKIVWHWNIVFNEESIQINNLKITSSSISSFKQTHQLFELECSELLSMNWEEEDSNIT